MSPTETRQTAQAGERAAWKFFLDSEESVGDISVYADVVISLVIRVRRKPAITLVRRRADRRRESSRDSDENLRAACIEHALFPPWRRFAAGERETFQRMKNPNFFSVSLSLFVSLSFLPFSSNRQDTRRSLLPSLILDAF